MSKFKLEFKLKQHTPIIHFQSHQDGATLRATELKPKLDKFLFSKNPNLPKTDKDSLNYKVKIISKDNEVKEINDRDPLFFANMGIDENEKKKFVVSDDLKIEFFSFDTNILKEINSNFASFLAINNFGTRQSKGFGSFFIDREFDKELIENDDFTKVYEFSTNYKNLYSDIALFYKLLRSGINLSYKREPFYAKSLLFLYANQKGLTWDKRAIKDYFVNRNMDRDKKYYLIKDLLGLSSSESWKNQRLNITKESKDIDRFKSPITFKPIKIGNGYKVYFWANKNIEILNREFFIQNSKRGNLKLKTPVKFDIDEFLKFAIETNTSKIEDNFKNRVEFRVLNKIFNEIKANL